MESATSPVTLRTTMRRVRLEELWVTKNCSACCAKPPSRANEAAARTRARFIEAIAMVAMGVALDLRLGLSRRQRRVGRLRRLRLGPFGFCGSIEHVSAGVSEMPIPSLRRGRTPLLPARQPPSQWVWF